MKIKAIVAAVALGSMSTAYAVDTSDIEDISMQPVDATVEIPEEAMRYLTLPETASARAVERATREGYGLSRANMARGATPPEMTDEGAGDDSSADAGDTTDDMPGDSGDDAGDDTTADAGDTTDDMPGDSGDDVGDDTSADAGDTMETMAIDGEALSEHAADSAEVVANATARAQEAMANASEHAQETVTSATEKAQEAIANARNSADNAAEQAAGRRPGV
ncbi:hypothetical protein [Kaarinaea lacus]